MPKAGALRVALACVAVLLLLSGGWAAREPATPAYLAAGLAAAFGVLVWVGGPWNLPSFRLVRVLVDCALISVLIFDTGGEGSPFFPLYFLAALEIVGVGGLARVFAGAIPTAGYLAASLASTGDLHALLAPLFALKALLLALACVAAGFVGYELQKARARARNLSSALAAERRQGVGVAALLAGIGPALETLDVEGILEWAAEGARRSLGVPYAHAALLEGTHHRTAAAEGSDAYPSWWHPTIQKLLLWSCRTGEIQRSEEAIGDMQGFVAVPISTPKDQGLGVLIAGGGEFGPEEERVLGLLAGEVASALERAEDAPGGRDPVSKLPNRASLLRFLKRELKRRSSLTILVADLDRFRLYNSFYGLKGGDDLLRKLGEKLRERHRRVFRQGEDEFVLVLTGSSSARAREAALGVRQTVWELTAASAVPLTSSVGFVTADPPHRDPDHLLAAASAALTHAKERPEGIFGAAADAELSPGEAGSSSGGAGAARAVSALVEAAEARDPYVGSHLRSVSSLALRLGARMGLTQSQMEDLAMGALLHDVGKIGLPDSVLLKPDDLTEEEYEIMKQHPVMGARILESLGGLSSAVPVVRHHHERFDGGGYPDGLEKEGIPLLARVVLVADAFDSMVRDRSYRRGTSAELALGEILRNSGTQFDPEVVAALAEILGERGNRKTDHAG